MKLSHLIIGILGMLLSIHLLGCSNKPATSNVQKVETGTVVSAKRIIIQPKPVQPNANVGVSVGTGGHAGVYGSVDVATIGRILSRPKPRIMQEVIVRRDNGSLVAITQIEMEPFYKGDKVKILLRGNQAKVVHN